MSVCVCVFVLQEIKMVYSTCSGCGEGSLRSDTLVEPRDSLSSLLAPLVILIELTTGD